MSENNIIKSTWLPNLDALRALAFLSVFVSHAVIFFGYKGGDFWSYFSKHFLIQGDLGVNFFFVLSGFLITYLIYTEKNKYNNFLIKSFYARRILRIWPVYFITLIFGIIISLFIKSLYISNGVDVSSLPFLLSVDSSEIPWYVFFLGNFDMAFWGASALSIAVLWSVSVEEQFYLIWPWITKIISDSLVPVFIALGIIAAFVYRYININDYNIVAYSSFSVMSDLFIGCLVGFIAAKRKVFIEKFININKTYSVFIWISLVVFLVSRSFFTSDLSRALSPLIFSIISALIIFDQVFCKNSFFKLDKVSFLNVNRILEWLGKRSYGLYCYHALGIVVIYSLFYFIFDINIYNVDIWEYVSMIICSLLFTVLITGVSFKYIESKILKLKKFFVRN